MSKNTQKQDLFEYRKGGAAFKIGGDNTAEDSITDMISLDNRMICILQRSIHSIMFADAADPSHTNPTLTNSQQSVLNYGSDDVIVGRTLVQANILFSNPVFTDNAQVEKLMKASLTFLEEISAVRDCAEKFKKLEQEADDKFSGKTESDGSLLLPSISNLKQIASEFIKKADRASYHICELARILFTIRGKSWCMALADIVSVSGLNDAANASKFFKSINHSVWQLRNIRNADEHPDPTHILNIETYLLNLDGRVEPPSIEYIDSDTPLQKIRLSRFMDISLSNLLIIFEDTCAILTILHTKPNSPFGSISVAQLSPEHRRQGRQHALYGYHFFTPPVVQQ